MRCNSVHVTVVNLNDSAEKDSVNIFKLFCRANTLAVSATLSHRLKELIIIIGHV